MLMIKWMMEGGVYIGLYELHGACFLYVGRYD